MNLLQQNAPMGHKLLQIDIVDQVVQALHASHADPSFIDQVLDDVPLALVVGAQSTGKSSVTSKLIGLPLETAAKRCTVIPLHISCRRGPNKLKLSLITHKGETRQIHEADGAAGIQKVLVDAKEEAMKDEQDEFAQSSFLRLDRHGPTQNNLSFVDYPGFTTSSDSAKELVQKSVERRINSPNAIVLHVIRADQDVDTIAGGVFMKEHWNKQRIIICTHCDCEKAKAYLPSVLEYAGSNKVFVVLGNVEDEDEELSRLRKAVDPTINVEFGVKALKIHMETLLETHTRKQLPKLCKRLEEKMRTIHSRIEQLDLGAPADIVQGTLREINKKWGPEMKGLKHEGRKCQETLVHCIRSILLCVPGEARGARPWRKMNQSDREGMVEGDLLRVDGQVCTFLKPHPTGLCYKTPKGEKYYTALSKCFVRGADDESIQKDVLDRCKRRGLTDLIDVDPVPILLAYTTQFAEDSEPALQEYVNDVKTLVKNAVDAAFVEPCKYEGTASKVLLKLKGQVQKEFKTRLDNAQKTLKDLLAHNTEKELCQANDSHYYNDLYKNMMEGVDGMAEDSGGILSIVCKIRARVKDARKTMVSFMKKQVWLELVVRFKKDVETILETRTSELVNEVTIPGGREGQIEELKTQFETLQRCVALIHEM